MAVDTGTPTSRRMYLSQDELSQYADINITNPTEADDQISQAEEIIDSYVGFQEKFLPYVIQGRAASGTTTTLTLETSHQNIYEADYFKWCQIEVIGGTGEHQRQTITTSTKAGVITVQNTWDTTPTSTSFYKIYQLGKFPRCERYGDVVYYSTATPYTYYKSIPEAVKRAVAAQVEFMIAQGADYFKTNKGKYTSESIDDYSYSKDGGSGAFVDTLIAPKAKDYLQGIRNRTGRLI